MSVFSPFIDFFVLWTEHSHQDEEHKDSGNSPTFPQRIYAMTGLTRLALLDMVLNTYQGTALRHFMVLINTCNQNAYQLLQAGQSALPAIAKFYALFPQYAAITLLICIITYFSRRNRTGYFYQIPEKMLKTIYRGYDPKVHKENDAIQQSLQDDKSRYESNVINIPKSYFNLTQNMVLFPFEMIMYLSTLGPQILATMLILAATCGLCMIQLSSKAKAAQAKKNEYQATIQENKEVDERYYEDFARYSNASLETKHVEIYQDLVKIFTGYGFNLAQIFICSQLLFIGQYDMALYAAQTQVGIQAFLRITNYLTLIIHHGRFEQDLKRKTDAFEIMSPEKLNQMKDNLPQYNWSTTHKGLLYIASTILLMGYKAIPVGQYLSYLSALVCLASLQQIASTVMLLWLTGGLLFQNTHTSSVDSTYLSILIQFAIVAGAAVVVVNSWPTLIPAIMSIPMYQRAAYSIIFSASVRLFDTHVRTRILFVMDYIGTWLSQEIFRAIKLPVASIKIATGINKSADYSQQQQPSVLNNSVPCC